MIRYFYFAFLVAFVAGCFDEKSNSDGGDEMNLSREEKFRILSEKGDSGDKDQADAIAKFLTDKDSEVVGRACFNLGYLGARNYISEIREFLVSKDQNLLVLCLSGLALMVDDRDGYLFDQIFPLLKQESKLVRMSAIEALGNIRSQKALEVLVESFDKEVPAVQYEIVRALGKTGDKNALPLLRAYKKAISAMDHSVPRKGGTRGSDPHPDVLELAVTAAISSLER